MKELHQIDCFTNNFRFLHVLGLWPNFIDGSPFRMYNYFSCFFCGIFIHVFIFLFTVDLILTPFDLFEYVALLLFYFTEMCVFSKTSTILLMRRRISKLLDTLESELFTPRNSAGQEIVQRAKDVNRRIFIFVAVISVTSVITHMIESVFDVVGDDKTVLPFSGYLFIPDFVKDSVLFYVLYGYQYTCITFHMCFNVCIDTFILGLIVLVNAQIDIINYELKLINNKDQDYDDVDLDRNSSIRDVVSIGELNKCIDHYEKVGTFCKDFQDIFSVHLFVQFTISSGIICVCLFTFLIPATMEYYVFLSTYIIVMVLQILGPCWLGTQMIAKSSSVSSAAYSCDWPRCSERFKRSLRVLMERSARPLSITGGGMFLLSLDTFTAILQTAYSFLTLLRNMQFRKAVNS